MVKFTTPFSFAVGFESHEIIKLINKRNMIDVLVVAMYQRMQFNWTFTLSLLTCNCSSTLLEGCTLRVRNIFVTNFIPKERSTLSYTFTCFLSSYTRILFWLIYQNENSYTKPKQKIFRHLDLLILLLYLKCLKMFMSLGFKLRLYFKWNNYVATNKRFFCEVLCNFLSNPLKRK